VLLAVAPAFTVAVISYTYSKIIEAFPYGGGGYAVTTRFLGAPAGVLAGTALVVDYVLTIAVSIASGGAAIFSYLPAQWDIFKIPVEILAILLLMILNVRGVKESVRVLLPFFLAFVATHLILILGGIGTHSYRFPELSRELNTGFTGGMTTLGAWGLFLLFIRAYSMGAGTYTGIEAVSNGIGILREPRVVTAKKTMLYMAVSLSFTAGGIILATALPVVPVAGKTMNAVLEAFAGDFSWGMPVGHAFVVLTPSSEAVPLSRPARPVTGAAVMANMAVDSWLPQFAARCPTA
jgi:amino acid transporter